MASGGGAGKSFLRVTESFFDRRAIMDKMAVAERRVFSRFGAFVRQSARQSIRRPRRMRVGELSKRQRFIYGVSEERNARGQFVVQKNRRLLPYAASKPGEPPRNQTGLLRDNIFFSYDAATQSVVIGPARLGGAGRAPAVLEYGGRGILGTTIKPRPYMVPALQKNIQKLLPMWRNSVRI